MGFPGASPIQIINPDETAKILSNGPTWLKLLFPILILVLVMIILITVFGGLK